MSGPDSSVVDDGFDRLIVPLLFADVVVAQTPRLQLVLGAGASGRSRATGRLTNDSVALNARDLAIAAVATGTATADVANQVAAQWLQRALASARERRISVTLEGSFRSSPLVAGLAQLFADAGYETGVVAVAERSAEVRMADASRRFDVELRQRRGFEVTAAGPVGSVEQVLTAVVSTRAVDRVTVLDRDGDTVVDAGRDDPDFDSAPRAFNEAASRPLGTLRSAGWLSELRHMTRFLVQQGSAPRWAVDELIALHEVALAEIVPELPIPESSETRQVQESRLSGALAALRNSVSTEATDDRTAAITIPQVGGVGLGR